jgi:hypothetical protein
MDEDLSIDDASCMLLDHKKKGSADQQLAFMMHRFNLDWETVEQMPALDEHRECLLPSPIKKELIE